MTHPNSLKNLRPYPKGISGNAGRSYSNLPDHLKGIRSLTHLEVVKLISKYARFTEREIDVALADPDAPMIELCFASIFKKCKEFGDFTRIGFLLDRSVGKAREIEEDDESNEARNELEKLSIKELLTLVKNNLPEDI